MFQFSQKLIYDCITNFKDEHEVDINAETANEYLNSFARLYMTMMRIEAETPSTLMRGGVSAPALSCSLTNLGMRPEQSPDLISPHSCN